MNLLTTICPIPVHQNEQKYYSKSLLCILFATEFMDLMAATDLRKIGQGQRKSGNVSGAKEKAKLVAKCRNILQLIGLISH